jgi:hypothetical protein
LERGLKVSFAGFFTFSEHFLFGVGEKEFLKASEASLQNGMVKNGERRKCEET